MTLSNQRQFPRSCSRSLLPALQAHMTKWSGCTDCSLSDNRLTSVFYRGDVPCTLLFIGECPDDAANARGVPFVPCPGQPGEFLDRYVPSGVSYAATYLTACGPPRSGDVEENQTAACFPRLLSFIQIAQPKVICTLGKPADSKILRNLQEVINQLNRRPVFIKVNHPVYVMNSKDQQAEVMRARAIIDKALEHLKKRG